MPTAINPPIHQTYSYTRETPSVFKRFLNWSERQQENRFLWLGIALAGHGCALTPITIYVVFLSGMSFPLFMAALVAMTMALVVNLAALPTKITIPVLVASAVIDVAIVITALGLGLNS